MTSSCIRTHFTASRDARVPPLTTEEETERGRSQRGSWTVGEVSLLGFDWAASLKVGGASW